MYRNVNRMQDWRYWRMSGTCRRLYNRLASWEREHQTNRNGFAYAAPFAIQAIKEQMRGLGCWAQ